MRKIQDSMNYVSPRGSDPGGPSLTVPDDSMSLMEILRRYSVGLPINGNSREQYYEEDYLPDLEKMDLEEIAQLTMENQEKRELLQKQLKDLENEKKSRKDRETFDAAVEKAAEIKSKSVKTSPKAESTNPS